MIVALRQANESDIDWITRACQDSEIQRWTIVPKPYSRGDAEEFVKITSNDVAKFVIIDRETELGVGTIAMTLESNGTCAAGYWVAPWARRRSVATQALRQLITHARTLTGVREITLKVSPENVASRGTAAKSGFIVVRTETGSCHDGNTATDGLIYSLTL